MGGHRSAEPRRSRVTMSARLTAGCRADLQVLDAPSYMHLAYRPGVPLVSQVWRNGVRAV